MILHIAPDDKFIPFLQSIFEEASPGKNLWRIRSAKPVPDFAVLNSNAQLIDDKYFFSVKFEDDLRDVNCVIFHSLFISGRQKFAVLRKINKQVKIIWRGWGYDYYPLLEANGLKLLLPQTKQLCNKTQLNKLVASKVIKKIVNVIVSFTVGFINRKFYSRIDYFSSCVPNDFVSLKGVIRNFRAQFLPLNYYSIEDVFLRGDNVQNLTGPDILLGNSSTASNNHLEAIQFLSQLGMSGRKVVVPLSYGDESYRAEVLRLGNLLLGDSFVPLTKYMSLAEYNQVISGCGNLLMNHVRQQAMGNISAALLRGGKVFLRPENPIYKYFTEMGAVLFCFSDKLTVSDFDNEIDPEIAIRNKEVMTKIWSRSHAVRQAQEICVLGITDK